MQVAPSTCPECGAAQTSGRICIDDFHQMLAWEIENPSLWEVHHLMVFCYHLQHPSLYSPDGLKWAKSTLVEFVEHGTTIEELRRQNRGKLDSGKRTWKVTGTPLSYGSYTYPPQWSMTAADIIAGGADSYCGNVREWASLVLQDLKASGNL